MAVQIPVLTYHAANVAGAEYAENDHVALAADLRLVDGLGWRVLSLDQVLAVLDGSLAPPSPRCLAVTFDDGTDFDVRPLDWPGQGRQPGFGPILADFRAEAGDRQPDLHATSFVIASPAARAAMDEQCLHGAGVLNDDWWPEAAASGLLAIGNHSWDHNHPVAPEAAPDGLKRGDFLAVDNAVRAAWQVARAQAFIAARVAPAPVRHFAYPWGQAPDYLRRHWLPRHGPRLGLVAAWTTQPRPARPGDDRWALPRYVCGAHWRSPDQLADLLAGSAA
mgnify:CR=1 FL=1